LIMYSSNTVYYNLWSLMNSRIQSFETSFSLEDHYISISSLHFYYSICWHTVFDVSNAVY
jgi:hypothetical protein